MRRLFGYYYHKFFSFLIIEKPTEAIDNNNNSCKRILQCTCTCIIMIVICYHRSSADPSHVRYNSCDVRGGPGHCAGSDITGCGLLSETHFER